MTKEINLYDDRVFFNCQRNLRLFKKAENTFLQQNLILLLLSPRQIH